MAALKTQAFNPETFRNLNIEEIISAPLIAASSANGSMAREQVRFLMDFCFTKEGDNYTPVMIKMAMVNGVVEPEKEKKREISVRQITTSFYLPLLTIIPISSLAIENVLVDFEIELTSQTTKNNSFEGTQGNLLTAPTAKPRLLGKISYDSKERSNQTSKSQSRNTNSSGLKVNIKAGQLPLPLGVTTLLNLYTKSISPYEPQNKTCDK